MTIAVYGYPYKGCRNDLNIVLEYWEESISQADKNALCPLQSELKACKTAASITEVVDGFEVLRTASVAETFRLYAAITKRLAVRDYNLLYQQLYLSV